MDENLQHKCPLQEQNQHRKIRPPPFLLNDMSLYLRTEIQTMNMKHFFSNEQKSKIPVASLDVLTHPEFAEVQTWKTFDQLFILGFTKNSEKWY